MSGEQPQPKAPKIMKIGLWFCVENNNKYIRGKTKVRDEIEQWVLRRYQMTKDRPDGWEYELSIPYQTDEELDAIIYDDILAEADQVADSRRCFIEADVSTVNDPARRW